MTDDLNPPQPGAPEGAVPPAAPPTYDAATYAQPKKTRRNRLGIVGGLLAALLVIGLKIGAAVGITTWFDSKDHEAKDAEDVVVKVLQADEGAEAAPYMVPAQQLKVDPSCSVLGDLDDQAEFKVEHSEKEADGSADVLVKFKSGEQVKVHLAHGTGWKVDGFTCK